MTRAVRWGVAGGCALVLVVVWAGVREMPGGLGFGLLASVFFGGIIGLMVAPDITRFFSNLFIGGILGDTDKFEQPPQAYSRARALVVQQRYTEAIEEYRRILETHPGDVQAQRAIVEIYLENLGDLEHGMEECGKLLGLKLEDVTRVTILMRLADLYEQRYNQPGYAADCLAEIVRRFPNTKYAAAATERLDQLKARRSQIAPDR